RSGIAELVRDLQDALPEFGGELVWPVVGIRDGSRRNQNRRCPARKQLRNRRSSGWRLFPLCRSPVARTIARLTFKALSSLCLKPYRMALQQAGKWSGSSFAGGGLTLTGGRGEVRQRTAGGDGIAKPFQAGGRSA